MDWFLGAICLVVCSMLLWKLGSVRTAFCVVAVARLRVGAVNFFLSLLQVLRCVIVMSLVNLLLRLLSLCCFFLEEQTIARLCKRTRHCRCCIDVCTVGATNMADLESWGACVYRCHLYTHMLCFGRFFYALHLLILRVSFL